MHAIGAKNDFDRDGIIVGLRIKDDMISISGDSMISLPPTKACKIKEVDYATNDELYFSSDGCKEASGYLERKKGTYNYLTQRLVFQQTFTQKQPESGFALASAIFECKRLK
jgi:hypothetical protein